MSIPVHTYCKSHEGRMRKDVDKSNQPGYRRNGHSGDDKDLSEKHGKRSRLSELLNRSLAIALVRVEKECGRRTVDKILEVLQDEFFDLKEFQKHVRNFEECQEITNNLLEDLELDLQNVS